MPSADPIADSEHTPSATTGSAGYPNWLPVVLLPALLAVLYGRTLDFAFAWDDLVYTSLPIYRLGDIRAVLTGPANGYEYLPVRDLVLIAEYKLFGDWTGGFHLVNLLLFAFAVLLVYPLYERLFSAAGNPAIHERSQQLAFASTLVFALHPLHVEAVCFVTALNALLALVFVVGSALAYLQHLDTRSPRWLAISVGLALLAMFSKATAVCLPVLLLLVHLYRVRDASLLRASLALSAHFAITAVAVGVHVWMARSSGILTVHASPGGLASRVPRVAATCVYYVRKFLWPHPLATEYDFQAILDQRLALIASALLVGAVFAVILWRGRRERSLAWLAVLAYLGALLPVMNLVEGNQAIADRYAQLPLLALAPLAIVPILVWLPRTASLAATAGVAALLFGVSVPQVAVWRDHETLMRHVIDVNPRAEQALRNLGMQYSVAGRDEEALAVFQKLALVGDHFFHLEYQRGTIAFEQERWGDAERWLRSATRESQRGRLRYLADMKLGELYRIQQRWSEAIAAYENAQVELRRASGDHEWGWRETEVALRELRSRRPRLQSPTRDESKGSR